MEAATLCPAPEVFQKKMHGLIEGLTGVDVIAADLVVVGFGDKLEDAHRSLDHNLLAFLKRCEERGVKLNSGNMKHSVCFLCFMSRCFTLVCRKIAQMS